MLPNLLVVLIKKCISLSQTVIKTHKRHTFSYRVYHLNTNQKNTLQIKIKTKHIQTFKLNFAIKSK